MHVLAPFNITKTLAKFCKIKNTVAYLFFIFRLSSNHGLPLVRHLLLRIWHFLQPLVPIIQQPREKHKNPILLLALAAAVQDAGLLLIAELPALPSYTPKRNSLGC